MTVDGGPSQQTSGPEIFRIASVDDDPSEHRLFSMVMKRTDLHADVTYYSSGEALLEGLADAEGNRTLPNVILLDLRMPGLGGYATLERLRSDQKLCSIPVVIFTSSTRPEERRAALEMGATAFQTKPHDLRAMEALIESLPQLAACGPVPA